MPFFRSDNCVLRWTGPTQQIYIHAPRPAFRTRPYHTTSRQSARLLIRFYGARRMLGHAPLLCSARSCRHTMPELILTALRLRSAPRHTQVLTAIILATTCYLTPHPTFLIVLHNILITVFQLKRTHSPTTCSRNVISIFPFNALLNVVKYCSMSQ